MNDFTIRVKPYNGESFSSFITRLGIKNGMGLLTICNLFKKSKNDYFQNSEISIINFVPSNHIDINKLSKAIGLNEDIILKTTLFYLIKAFCEEGNAERVRFITGLISDNFRYYPCCLKEENYHRLVWSINSIKVCITHKKRLVDRCFKCNNKLHLKDMMIANICPYCGFNLSSMMVNEKIDDEELGSQTWVTKTCKTLLYYNRQKLKSNEVAIKILYILSESKIVFDRKIIKENLEIYSSIETLLQYARNSLPTKRMMHLSYLLQVLYQYNVSIEEFMSMSIPLEFIKSVTQEFQSKKEKMSCLAPWCINYNINDNLMKTGTTFKLKSRGKTLLYYLACPECGCEYAFDINGDFIERTYFIDTYKKLLRVWHKELSLTEIANAINLSLDKTKRCLAYFNSRKMFVGNASNNTEFIINEEYLNAFKEAVENNGNIKDIEKWSTWKSYSGSCFTDLM